MHQVKKISRGALTAIIILSILTSAMLGTTLYFALRKAPMLGGNMEYVYQASFRRLTDSVDGLEENLALMNVAYSREAKQKIAGRVWRQSGEAAANLTTLPVEHHSLEETYVLLNRIGDYLYSISEHLAYGEDMTKVQTESVTALYLETARVREKLDALDATMTGYRFSDHLEKGAQSVVVDAFDGSKCPTLDYAGAFSEKVENSNFEYVKTLEKIDEIKALERANQFFKGLSSSGTTDGSMPCYVFTGENSAHLELTQHGGMIASFTQEVQEGAEVSLQAAEASDAAIKFAEKAYGGVFAEVRLYSEGETAVVVVAPKEGNVLYESESIQLKIDLNSGGVCGVNAMGYLSARVEHNSSLKPTLSVTDAARKVNPSLAAKCLRLSVVSSGGAKLVYVFSGELGGKTYISHVDALDGREVDIFRVSSLDSEY